MRNSRSNSRSNREEFTIAVIGGGGVGKSTLIIRFVQNVFVEEYDSSTGGKNIFHLWLQYHIIIINHSLIHTKIPKQFQLYMTDVVLLMAATASLRLLTL